MRSPSPGFLLLAAVTIGTAAFFLWGAGEPELDRVWWRLHELKTGRVDRLAGDDLELLRRTVTAHAELAPALLDDQPAGLLSAHTDGWLETGTAYLLVQPGLLEDPVIAFDCRLPAEAYPAALILAGPDASEEIRFEQADSVSHPVSREVRAGGVVELRLETEGNHGAKAGIQVRFPRSP